MDIKMKCMYNEGLKKCKHPGTYTCVDCKIQLFYCKLHAGGHIIDTNHKTIEISGLKYFKTQIKASISKIAQYTNDVIAEIRKASLRVVIDLKILNKNAKNIDELTLKSYDSKRISFLVEQARDIDKIMNETPKEATERLNKLLNEKEAIITRQQNETAIARQQNEAMITRQNKEATERLTKLLNDKEAIITRQQNEAAKARQQNEAIITRQQNDNEKLNIRIQELTKTQIGRQSITQLSPPANQGTI